MPVVHRKIRDDRDDTEHRQFDHPNDGAQEQDAEFAEVRMRSQYWQMADHRPQQLAEQRLADERHHKHRDRLGR